MTGQVAGMGGIPDLGVGRRMTRLWGRARGGAQEAHWGGAGPECGVGRQRARRADATTCTAAHYENSAHEAVRSSQSGLRAGSDAAQAGWRAGLADERAGDIETKLRNLADRTVTFGRVGR